jgi:hypothetical protein
MKLFFISGFSLPESYILFLIVFAVIKYRINHNEAFRKKIILKLKNLSIIFFMPSWLLIAFFSIFFIILVNLDKNSKDSLNYENESEKYQSPEKESHYERKKVTVYEAEEFMRSRCVASNQIIEATKTVNFNGVKLFMFLTISENGSVCISSISENALEILAVDCGSAEMKIQQWNEIY